MSRGFGRTESRKGSHKSGVNSGARAFGTRPGEEVSTLKMTPPPCFFKKPGGRRSLLPNMAMLAVMIFAGYFSTGGSVQIMPQATAASLHAALINAPSLVISPVIVSSEGTKPSLKDAAPLAPSVKPEVPVASSPRQVSLVTHYIPDPPPTDTDGKYQVQAVLAAKSSAVLSSAIDARIIDLHFRSGDHFNRGDTLVEFDCGVDRAKLTELQVRQSLSARQLEAYNQLRKLKTVSEIELQTASASNAQNLAQIDQVSQHINLCRIVAPFDGIIMRTMANNYEFAQTGRVLMEVASREPLQAEFLVSSVWLRWLNIGTPVSIYIDESGKRYDAKLARINGEVDPVSQSVQVVAEMVRYNEELLPGMSGKAIFNTDGADAVDKFGYHGMILEPLPAGPIRPK